MNSTPTPQKKNLKKGKKPKQIIMKNYKTINWTGRLKEAFHQPEVNGNWIVAGESGNGKTSFVLQLAQELSKIMKVQITSMEEGDRLTMSEKLQKMKMMDAGFTIINEPLEDTLQRLDKRRGPKVVVVDSLQYTGINYSEYKRIKEQYSHKCLFIWISHADGKKPDGATANKVWYDADLKIRCEGYRAISNGRYNPGGYFDIWPQMAAKYWGTDDNNEA